MDGSAEVQNDGEGLPPPHNEVLRANGLGVVFLIVSCCLQVTTLDSQGCCGKEVHERLGQCDNIVKAKIPLSED